MEESRFLDVSENTNVFIVFWGIKLTHTQLKRRENIEEIGKLQFRVLYGISLMREVLEKINILTAPFKKHEGSKLS